MEGVKAATGYTDEFLVTMGAAPGSCVVMTPNAYMTKAAWAEIAPKIARGIRQLPFVRDHPNWWFWFSVDVLRMDSF
jgi:hypothetical protein